MKTSRHAADLIDLAQRVIWFEPPEQALSDQVRFLAYLMTYGSTADVLIAQRFFTPEDFRQAVENAPPGILDERSWAYWNVMAGRYPPPPMPKRRLPDGNG